MYGLLVFLTPAYFIAKSYAAKMVFLFIFFGGCGGDGVCRSMLKDPQLLTHVVTRVIEIDRQAFLHSLFLNFSLFYY